LIAAYALRLSRVFGVRRVGYLLVGVFVLLAATNLAQGLKPGTQAPATGADFVYLIIPLLLVIGMAHTEVMIAQRLRIECERERANSEFEVERNEKTTLEKSCEQLTRELTQRRLSEAALKEREQRYCELFADNPQPMWIFDLRTYRFLAVNRAALRLLGFTEEELLAITAKDVRPAADVAAFAQDAARPNVSVQSRGVWRHTKKDGKLLHLELTALDLVYTSYPARLVMAKDASGDYLAELRLKEAQKMGVL
jgi:PAS domain S-box-containing protein